MACYLDFDCAQMGLDENGKCLNEEVCHLELWDEFEGLRRQVAPEYAIDRDSLDSNPF